jgi:hypothetical protein
MRAWTDLLDLVELVNYAESLQKWSEVATAASSMPEFVARPMFDFFCTLI